MEAQVIVVAGSNDHLQSRGLLSRLTDRSIPSNKVIGEAIMTLLSAMAEVELECTVGNRLAREDERLEDSPAPISLATKQKRHGRR